VWNKNEREGTANQAKGRVKQAVGTLTGNADLKTEGVIDESRGKIEVAVGRLRRKSDTVIRGRAQSAEAVTTPPRPNVTLDAFIGANRDEIILRCRAKVAKHSVPPPSEALRRGTITDNPRAVLDATLVRIETLKAHLTARIRESQDARARLVEALKANEALLETFEGARLVRRAEHLAAILTRGRR
jgi:uncharacterized protein YjbJ (UPF0337 family)